MLTLRTLAIVITGAGILASVPFTGAQACDDDRYPCPIRVPQEIADAPAQAAPAAQPQRKASQPARQNAKREREAPRAVARTKPSKPAAQEQAAAPVSQKGAEAAPAMVPPPRADQSLGDASRGESSVAAAGTAWPVLPMTEGAGAPAAAGANATEAATTNAATNAVTAAATDAVTNAVQVVDKNEVNDLDRAAAASVPAESSWLTYLLFILGVALAAASAFWFVFRTASRFPRRAAAHPRMH